MEKSIRIDLQEETFDVEIRGLSLGNIKNLAVLPDDVAVNLKTVMLLNGADPVKTDEAVRTLLRQTGDIRRILKVCFGQ